MDTLPAATAYITRLWLGGINIPCTAVAHVRPVAYSVEKPWDFMSLISIGPRAAMSALGEPEIPPKNMEASTLTMAAPPWNQPTSSSASRISLSPIPP